MVDNVSNMVKITNIKSTDLVKKCSISFKNNNIFGGNLDFLDQPNGDFHIGENSVLVDAGTTSTEGITFPDTDFDGNYRIVG